jgi:hypothetical protein
MECWKRDCPKCGEELFYTRKFSKIRAEKGNTNCKSCSVTGRHKGKKLSNEHKKNISDSNKGQVPWNKGLTKETNDVIKSISESLKGRKITWGNKISEANKGQKRSEETKLKMRLSRIEEIEKNNGQISPNYSPVACGIINDYNKKYGFNFRHAENGGEVCIDGYWPDGVDEKRKTIIEVDEKHHFNPDGTLKKKNRERQMYLENLGYKFIRIKL